MKTSSSGVGPSTATSARPGPARVARSLLVVVVVITVLLAGGWELGVQAALSEAAATPTATSAPTGGADAALATSTPAPDSENGFPYAQAGRYRRASGAIVEVSSFYSISLERPMAYAVVLPPGYEEGTRRYAVLTMLHGLAGGYGSWLELGLEEVFEELYAAGRIDPFIIALPEGEASYYVNHADDGAAWGDYIGQDFVDQIDATYRTFAAPASRAIGGLSMGGEGALQLALNYPGVFEVVGAHTPTTRLDFADAPGSIYGDEEYWQEHNSLWLIENRDTVFALQIWIDDGFDDVWLGAAEALHQALLGRGVAHQYHIYAGSHGYWAEVMDDYLRFYSAALETGGADPLQPIVPRRRAGRSIKTD